MLDRRPSTPETSLTPAGATGRPDQLATSLTPRGVGVSLGAVADCSSGRPSPAAALDASLMPSADVAPVPERHCGWCRSPLEPTRLRWCGKKCRQTAWRARELAVVEDAAGTPKRLKYADPPYPGLAKRYYQHEASYAGEVDHAALIASLMEQADGWALSTSAKALRDVLPLCPPEARVCSWVKPIGCCPNTRGIHNLWEPLIVVPARRRKPGVPDTLVTQPARGGGTLPGRKPLKFVMWMFALLGASPMDELDDLFPGTGIVSKAFGQFCAKGRQV